MNYSGLTDDELDRLSHECFLRKETLIKEYRKNNAVPSRGMISTPEIDDLRKKIDALTMEYLKRHTKKK